MLGINSVGLLLSLSLFWASFFSNVAAVISPRAMIVSMFYLEANPWYANINFTQNITVVGFSAEYPIVRCNANSTICQMTTGEGKANAGPSLMALILSPMFNLTQTYFLIAGIAGVNPYRGTLGSAAFARYAIDVDLVHEVDGREAPAGYASGFWGLQTTGASQYMYPSSFPYENVFELNSVLLNKIIALTQKVVLSDSANAQAYRARFNYGPANQPPGILRCDSATADVYWAGEIIGNFVSNWTSVLTQGQGIYCMSQQEDNASLSSLYRAYTFGLVDFGRIAILRTGSDFDRQYPNQTAFQSLTTSQGGTTPAVNNLYLAGIPFISAVVNNWDGANGWARGVPA